MTCEPGTCTVAHGYEDDWGGFVSREEVVETIRLAVSSGRSWMRNPHADTYIKSRKRKVFRSHDARVILEEEDLDCFNHCPRCGTAVDWDTVTAEYRLT